MAQVEWTDDFERRLTAKLEEDYKQADNVVVMASYATKPLEEGGIIDAKDSAASMVTWIKKELGI